MISLNELEVFIAAAEHGSFSEAARRLHLSQPAVSQCIQSLERRFRVELFTRQGKAARLSDAGKALLPLARELLTASVRLEETMSSLNGIIAGHIQVGCSTASGKYILPPMIARFRREFGTVRVDVQVSNREQAVERLLDETIDFAVSSKTVDHRDLEHLPFYEDDVILIVPASHPWARNCVIYPDDLMDAPLILREPSSATYEVVYKGLLAHDLPLDLMNVVMVLGNAEAIALSVEEGIGVAFTSRLAAAHGLALGRIVEVRIEGLNLHHLLYFLRNRRTPLTPAQNSFWEFVRQPLVSNA